MNVLTAAIAAEGASTMKTITSQRKTASTPNTTRQEQEDDGRPFSVPGVVPPLAEAGPGIHAAHVR